MTSDFAKASPFDHLEAARKLNKAMVVRCKSGHMTPEWFLHMAAAQEKNLRAIDQMLSATNSEFMDSLNQLIEAEENTQIKSEARPVPPGNVVKIDFNNRNAGGRKDG